MSAQSATPVESTRADGVFEGGGVKGIAFAGAIKAAEEQMGVREWINVAGASAGAIVASLLVTGHGATSLRNVLDATDYRRFADYGCGVANPCSGDSSSRSPSQFENASARGP